MPPSVYHRPSSSLSFYHHLNPLLIGDGRLEMMRDGSVTIMECFKIRLKMKLNLFPLKQLVPKQFITSHIDEECRDRHERRKDDSDRVEKVGYKKCLRR